MTNKSYDALIIDQDFSAYTDEQHETWRLLYERQMNVLKPRVCPEYLDAIDVLGFTPDHIPNFQEVNERLRAATGWEVVANDCLNWLKK